jgi:hypothetical protein
VAGLVQRRLIEVENESIEEKAKPQRDDVHGAKRCHGRKRRNDGDGDEYSGPSDRAEVRPYQAQGLAVGRDIGEVARRLGYCSRGCGGYFSRHVHASESLIPPHAIIATPSAAMRLIPGSVEFCAAGASRSRCKATLSWLACAND